MCRIALLVSSSLLVLSVIHGVAGSCQELRSAQGSDAEFSSSRAAESALPDDPGEAVLATTRRPDLYSNTIRGPFSTVGLAVTTGTLGIGVQVATPVAMRLNLRVGGSFFTYHSPVYTDSGVNYSGTLRLQSVQAMVDWFPFGGGFHISPGLQVYNGFGGSGKADVPAGESLTVNHTNFLSDPSAPLTGSATLRTNRVAPMLLAGFGNLVPRVNRHLSFPVEFGVTYQGAPKINFSLAGNACDSQGNYCQPVAGYAELQENLSVQQKTINSDANPYRFFPIVSVGFGYKF